MIGLDGFTLSHTLENVKVLSDDVAAKFVGTRQLPKVETHSGKTVPYRLDPANPMTMGPIALQNYYFEFKRQQEEAMKKAHDIIKDIHDEYARISERRYGDGLVDGYEIDDAELVIVCLGSTAGTVKAVIDDLRTDGIKCGLLRIRTYRPFPARAIASALNEAKAVAVMDRSISFGGNGGAVFHEVRHALYDITKHPYIVNYIYGLGGRDTNPSQIRKIFEDLQNIVKNRHVDELVRYVGLRE
jgi:pyruvate ferredoxin oxidoreductase alpha subunit